jgi:hypothetical protein
MWENLINYYTKQSLALKAYSFWCGQETTSPFTEPEDSRPYLKSQQQVPNLSQLNPIHILNIYVCVCVCVCVYIYIYIYIYMHMISEG